MMPAILLVITQSQSQSPVSVGVDGGGRFVTRQSGQPCAHLDRPMNTPAFQGMIPESSNTPTLHPMRAQISERPRSHEILVLAMQILHGVSLPFLGPGAVAEAPSPPSAGTVPGWGPRPSWAMDPGRRVSSSFARAFLQNTTMLVGIAMPLMMKQPTSMSPCRAPTAPSTSTKSACGPSKSASQGAAHKRTDARTSHCKRNRVTLPVPVLRRCPVRRKFRSAQKAPAPAALSSWTAAAGPHARPCFRGGPTDRHGAWSARHHAHGRRGTGRDPGLRAADPQACTAQPIPGKRGSGTMHTCVWIDAASSTRWAGCIGDGPLPAICRRRLAGAAPQVQEGDACRCKSIDHGAHF